MNYPRANQENPTALFPGLLIHWYEKNKRDLPWRKSRDPYKIMVSEFMLVQTTVATVSRRYNDFLKKFPTIETLARSPLWKVKNAWTGLGYNRRAVNLWNAARQIGALRKFPKTPQELIKIPGFGPYLSAAVSSIAFDVSAPLLDTNVKRILLRIFNTDDPGILEIFLSLPKIRPSVFNQALMELGALVCQARRAHCSICPVAQFCLTKGIHPLESKSKTSKNIELLIQVNKDNQGQILLVKRGSQEPFLKNSWGLPCSVLDSCPGKNNHRTFSHSITQWKIHAHVKKNISLNLPVNNSLLVAAKNLKKFLFSSLWWKALSCAAIVFLTSCASQKYAQKSQQSTLLAPVAVESKIVVEQSQTISQTHKNPDQQISAPAFITIDAVGDVLLGSLTPKPPEIPINNGLSLYDDVKPYLNADIVFANLEGPVADGITPAKCPKNKVQKGCFEFIMPTKLLISLKNAGFNVVSINNNHSLDAGSKGYLATAKALNAINLKFAGKETEIAYFEIKGVKIALIAFGFGADPAFPNILDIPKAKSLIKRVSQENPIVIISFHGGAEGAAALHLPTTMEIFEKTRRGDLRAFAHAAIDAGADLIIGHSPHVPRAMELYQGRLIAYSLGNFQTYGKMSLRGINAYAPLLKAKINADNGTFKEGRIISFVQEEPGIPKFDPEGKAAQLIQKLSQEDIALNTLQITNEGNLLIKR